VAAIAWSAHFLYFRRFGLYEDDVFVLAPLMTWTWRRALSAALQIVQTLPQGRPIGFLVATVVPFACFQLGAVRGLALLYLAASAIVVANALLAHRLFSAVYGPSFALLGALAFTLYPADTTQPFLTHALVLQPSLTFVLLALLAYTRGRSVLAYILAACCLLTYESGVLAFFAAPLLKPAWERATVGRWVRHVALMLAIVIGVLALRVAVGEHRTVALEQEQGVTWADVPSRVVRAVWTGPQVSLSAFLTRPDWAAMEYRDPPFAAGVAAAFAAILAALAGSGFSARVAPPPVLLRAALTGMVMVAGGYALEFSGWHFPPLHEAGRMSAVHLGATLGAATLVAALLSLGWALVRRRGAQLAVAVLASAYLASLFGYRLAVQRGFAAAAGQQREYWSRIMSLVPDLSSDTVVILLGSEPPRNRFILPSSWSDTWVIRFLFHDAAGHSPFLVGGYVPLRRGAAETGFDETLLRRAGNGSLDWSSEVPGWMRVDRGRPLQSGPVVVLERQGFEWRRRSGSITLQGVEVALPPASAGTTHRLVPGPLYDLLIAPARSGSGSAP
jgi:hypothetical protein